MADLEHKTIIGPLTAALLYAALLGASFALLTGTPRTIALIVVCGLAAKSYIDFLRRRME
jgi:Asp/Glu/hydantoin racemase